MEIGVLGSLLLQGLLYCIYPFLVNYTNCITLTFIPFSSQIYLYIRHLILANKFGFKAGQSRGNNI